MRFICGDQCHTWCWWLCRGGCGSWGLVLTACREMVELPVPCVARTYIPSSLAVLTWWLSFIALDSELECYLEKKRKTKKRNSVWPEISYFNPPLNTRQAALAAWNTDHIVWSGYVTFIALVGAEADTLREYEVLSGVFQGSPQLNSHEIPAAHWARGFPACLAFIGIGAWRKMDLLAHSWLIFRCSELHIHLWCLLPSNVEICIFWEMLPEYMFRSFPKPHLNTTYIYITKFVFTSEFQGEKSLLSATMDDSN